MSLAQLQRLLPLPEEDLKQALDYANTLSKQAAAEHFNNLLGESPGSIEFISSFNSRRQDPTAKPTPQTQTQTSAQASTSTSAPKSTRGSKKKKPPIHTPAPRQVHGIYGGQGTAYKKKDEDDYVSRRSTPQPSTSKSSSTANALALDTGSSAIQSPTPRPPPSAAGTLISDFNRKPKSTSSSRAVSQNPSRNASPAPKPKPATTKINITGGNAMHGASTALSDLDAAIRTLEISTNSSLSTDPSKRKCNCIATRHPLLAAAPNCLSCGKVICVKEGFGPCTFCGSAILGRDEVQSMIRTLKEERGAEKMRLDASSHRRADISRTTPAPFSAPKNLDMTPAEQKAKEHRDTLLGFQAQNAKRTTVKDEAADFDTGLAASVAAGVGGGSGMGGMWASPAERAKELKRQQKVLAEQEWNARPEYEKRRQVVSVDLVGGKIVKRMARIERPTFESEGEGEEETVDEVENTNMRGNNGGGGTFSRNPLLGGLIKPIWKAAKGKEVEGAVAGSGEGSVANDEDAYTRKKKTWRRVQDDMDDNEDIILNGGAFGGNQGMENRREGVEEHAVG
ncbi:hypothetical protein SBOR_5808 [Sclerotinia borealis F-4128]|uniref:TRIP4/RQT4 C2HC5-type zinc finger domain-containing protein n=1 Tax=Sclerotinia borealis (strain F-4128) TaxID=1432307 RepID=W9CDB3_SCLBF|nr:hypothetical protein SBOR_5808 [Sclerotinia borealis F-4128]